MYNEFGGTLSNLALAKHRKSRAINAENPKGEKGKGGMAASHLGPSRKGSPCLNDIASGQTVTLAEIEGPGAINHIWITVDAKTTDRNLSAPASTVPLSDTLQSLPDNHQICKLCV